MGHMGTNCKNKRIDVGNRMSRETFIDIISKKQPEFKVDRIKEILCLKNKNSIEIIQISEQQKIQIYNDGKTKWQLNSSVNPEYASFLWAEQFSDIEINEHSIMFIFGMGDGLSIEYLVRKNPNCNILIYEPSIEIFNDTISRCIWNDILEKSNIRIYVKGINEEFFFNDLQGVVDYTNINLLHLGVLPNYDRIFTSEYNHFRETIADVMRLVLYTKNTEIQRSGEMAHNMYKLSNDIIHQYSVKQLLQVGNILASKNMPAILVAAGPSLDSNIECLHKFKNKAFILGVDTALNTLLKNDIIPDLTISVDSRKPIELFRNLKFKDIPIVLSQQSNSEIIDKNKSKHFYEWDEEGYLNKIFGQLTGKYGIQLPTGGSVANNALSLLVLMGFKTIILVGQDLAYPNMQEHTQGAYKNQKNVIDLNREEFILVDDVNGKKVYTKPNMNIYRKWMEHYIVGYKDIRVINTSEQGAFIAGTDKMFLKDCLKFCSNENLNITEMISKIEPCFNEHELKRIHDTLCGIPMTMKTIGEKIDVGVQICKDTKDLFDKKQFMGIKDNLQKIMQIADEIEQYPETILLRPYTIEEQYDVQENIYQYNEVDAIDNQIKDSIYNAMKLMKAYENGIRKFRKDMYQLVPKE